MSCVNYNNIVKKNEAESFIRAIEAKASIGGRVRNRDSALKRVFAFYGCLGRDGTGKPKAQDIDLGQQGAKGGGRHCCD